jgi:predicted Zn-dependent protease
VFGSIATQSGVAVPKSTSVELLCGMNPVKAIHPDLNGNFQFNLQAGPQSDADFSAAVGPSMKQPISPMDSTNAAAGPGGFAGPYSDCELRVSAPGYQPLSKVVMMRTANVGGLDVGSLVLTPLAREQGPTVSVNSLLAPKNARKEYDKAEKDIRGNKLPSAVRHLENAVAEYDKYAAAWNDLGRIYLTQRQNDQAGHAFSKAIAADPQYLPPYVGLAELQLQDAQYEVAAETAGKALALSPGLVTADFIRAAADFKLNRLDAAEKSARDAEHGAHQNIEQLHLLLADILLAKGNYPGAADEMRAYLKEYPQGEFAAKVKDRLPEIEKLAGAAGDRPASSEN